MNPFTDLFEIGTLPFPFQISGSETDAVEKVQCQCLSKAKEFKEAVKFRLIDENGWDELAGMSRSCFNLFDYAKDKNTKEDNFHLY